MSKSKAKRSTRRGRSTQSSILPVAIEETQAVESSSDKRSSSPSRSTGLDLSSDQFFDDPLEMDDRETVLTPKRAGRSTAARRASDFTPSFSFDLGSRDEEIDSAELFTLADAEDHANQVSKSSASIQDSEKTSQSAKKKSKSTTKKSKSAAKKTQAESAQVSLLSDFWGELDKEELNKEEDRFNEFFEDSIHNTKVSSRDQDDSVSKRIQVGLYPADAELLEELFLQSKAAGLKNVSRARILRVALRHFHTCWLNADQSS